MPISSLNDAPWSAAFICWVVKTASTRTNVPLRFPYSIIDPTTGNRIPVEGHAQYSQEIRTNPQQYSFDVLDPFQNGRPRELLEGDILVANRGRNTLTYNTAVWTGQTHGDIIVDDNFGTGGDAIGGNLADRVSKVVRNINRVDKYFVILRPRNRAHAVLIRDVAIEELREWRGGITENTPKGSELVKKYWSAVGIDRRPSTYSSTVVNIPSASRGAITPFIEGLESFHPSIQYELTRRRVSKETANTYMPFVKLTSLTRIKSENLAGGGTAYCPSLGIHNQNRVDFENIYLPRNNRSVIGYAIKDDGKEEVQVLVKNAAADAANIPMPGITQINVERGTAGPMGVRGGLVKAEMKIAAYSVGQVDALLRYFLRPATRVVLELGRLSSNQNQNEKPIRPYNWKQKETDIINYFSDLIRSPDKQKEFINQYVYNNYGNYEIFIAYVVKFNLKYTKNNIFEIDLTLHSVQQFEVPTKHTGVTSTCANPTKPCNVVDIQEYFNDSYAWKNNSFSNLISYYLNATEGEDATWKSSIIPIKNRSDSETGAASTQAGTRENEYFVSWRFFIEKILNDRNYGIASILGNKDPLIELALPRLSYEPSGSLVNTGLIANQVGYHPNLRSVNPEVMVIYNPIAQREYDASSDRSRFRSVIRAATSGSTQPDVLTNNTLYQQISGSSVPFTNVLDTQERPGASFLSRGVWLNTKSIKQAFTSTDTISSAISMLLSMMNSATEGYWNLQLYSTDVKNPGMHIIDMGLSKPPTKVAQSPNKLLWIDKEENETNNILDSINKITETRYRSQADRDKPQYIYMFNRGIKRFRDGELGSDLIDLNVEFNLPQVVAVQAIANIGGPAQKSLLQSIDVKELKDITLINNLYVDCSPSSDICADEDTCNQDVDFNLSEAVRIAEQELRDLQLRSQEASNQIPGNLTDRRSIISSEITTAETNLRNAQDARDARTAEVALGNPNLVGIVREYADLGTALELVEINPSRMIKKLNIDSTSADDLVPRTIPKAHAFNSSNLTKTVVDVTLPGIGGISLFQSFLVDRVPSILERGFYVVTKVTHEFTTQMGWITKIQGRFRYRPQAEGTGEPNPCSASAQVGAAGDPNRVRAIRGG